METKEIVEAIILLFFILLLVFVVNIVFYKPTFRDFFKAFNTSQAYFIVNASQYQNLVVQCAIKVVYESTLLGKNTNALGFMVIQNNTCSYSTSLGSPKAQIFNSSASECIKKANEGVSVYFIFNPNQNKTTIFARKMIVEGDNNFYSLCPIYSLFSALR
ncbi:MAG: hypothetical protein ACP5HJ_02910 [Candidatus Micrarchaeia archaeon]